MHPKKHKKNMPKIRGGQSCEADFIPLTMLKPGCIKKLIHRAMAKKARVG